MQSLRRLMPYYLKQCLTTINRIKTLPNSMTTNSVQLNYCVRHKHIKYTGIQGGKPKKAAAASSKLDTTPIDDDDDAAAAATDIDNSIEYDSLVHNAMNLSRDRRHAKNILVVQPHIKWGAQKKVTRPETQLQEAQALVKSIAQWTIGASILVPLESLEKKTVFGSGKLMEIKELLSQLRQSGCGIDAIFVSKGTLSHGQKQSLQEYFGVAVLDRFSVVIQILRMNACSVEAKLQVAMAEIPYIVGQMRDGAAQRLSLPQKQMLREREVKLKAALSKVRSHRELLRNKRKKMDLPVVAVVGYTNAGKTSLIKALTHETKLQPKNQLFATLDVTTHAGKLPCNLDVIYVDTVGFISDIPTQLIECFVATLEDAMLADLIIHVQDVSHDSHLEQRLHVEETLKRLNATSGPQTNILLENIVNVGNKVDLLDEERQHQLQLSNKDNNLHVVSTVTRDGIGALLLQIEEVILAKTNRSKIVIKVPMGGNEMAWLYKNAAIIESSADTEDSQCMRLVVVISNIKLNQFKNMLGRF